MCSLLCRDLWGPASTLAVLVQDYIVQISQLAIADCTKKVIHIL